MADNGLGPEGWYPEHQPNCLGCGPENPLSLGLRMRDRGEGVAGRVSFGPAHEGAPGFAHGGAVATALDDALGMMLMRLRSPAVTAHLEIDYRRPAFVGREYAIEAGLERLEGRKLWLAARLLTEEVVVAEASGLFITVDEEHFLQGGSDAPFAKRMGSEDPSLPW